MANKVNLQPVTVLTTASLTPTTINNSAALHRGTAEPPTSGTQIPVGPQRWPI